jgi:hypothetical protein
VNRSGRARRLRTFSPDAQSDGPRPRVVIPAGSVPGPGPVGWSSGRSRSLFAQQQAQRAARCLRAHGLTRRRSCRDQDGRERLSRDLRLLTGRKRLLINPAIKQSWRLDDATQGWLAIPASDPRGAPTRRGRTTRSWPAGLLAGTPSLNDCRIRSSRLEPAPGWQFPWRSFRGFQPQPPMGARCRKQRAKVPPIRQSGKTQGDRP